MTYVVGCVRSYKGIQKSYLDRSGEFPNAYPTNLFRMRWYREVCPINRPQDDSNMNPKQNTNCPTCQAYDVARRVRLTYRIPIARRVRLTPVSGLRPTCPSTILHACTTTDNNTRQFVNHGQQHSYIGKSKWARVPLNGHNVLKRP